MTNRHDKNGRRFTMAAHKSEMMDAIEALAKAKDISVDQIVSAV